MIIPERKKSVKIILSKFGNKEEMPHLSKGGEVPKVGESPMPDMEAKHAHMQELISSIHNNDHEAATQHMMRFLEENELHQHKEDSPSDYSPEEK